MSQKERKGTHGHRQNRVITRGKGGFGEVEEGKGGINGDGRRLDLSW